MRNRMERAAASPGILLAVILCLPGIAGCISPVPHPDERALGKARSEDPTVTLADLQEGRKLYVSNCSGCHNLHIPSQFGDSEWSRWVETMRERSRLTSEETVSITRYLIAVND